MIVSRAGRQVGRRNRSPGRLSRAARPFQWPTVALIIFAYFWPDKKSIRHQPLGRHLNWRRPVVAARRSLGELSPRDPAGWMHLGGTDSHRAAAAKVATCCTTSPPSPTPTPTSTPTPTPASTSSSVRRCGNKLCQSLASCVPKCRPIQIGLRLATGGRRSGPFCIQPARASHLLPPE